MTTEQQSQTENNTQDNNTTLKESKKTKAGEFDNFEVETEKAEAIRNNLESIKQETKLMLSLRNLCQNKGIDENLEASNESFPGFKKARGDKPKVFEILDPEHTAQGLKLWTYSQDLNVFIHSSEVFSLSFLPKNSEFLVNSFNSDLWTSFLEKTADLKSEFEEARKLKAEKAKAFKEKFKKAKKRSI